MKTPILVIKTIDGAEVVGKIDADKINDTQVTVLDPLEIRYRTGEDGYSQAVLTKYNYFGASNAVRINKTSIITVYEIAPEYQRLYEKSISSIEDDTKKRRAELSDRKGLPEDVKDMLDRVVSNKTLH